MKKFAVVGVFLAACGGWAQSPAEQKPAFLMQGLSNLHHPVSTQNPEAQQFFDQGLRLVYAFNHEEAARSFQPRGRTRSAPGHGLVGRGAGRGPEL